MRNIHCIRCGLEFFTNVSTANCPNCGGFSILAETVVNCSADVREKELSAQPTETRRPPDDGNTEWHPENCDSCGAPFFTQSEKRCPACQIVVEGHPQQLQQERSRRRTASTKWTNPNPMSHPYSAGKPSNRLSGEVNGTLVVFIAVGIAIAAVGIFVSVSSPNPQSAGYTYLLAVCAIGGGIAGVMEAIRKHRGY